MKKLFGILFMFCMIIGLPNYAVKAEEYKEVFIEGIEDMTPEEGAAYFEEYTGIPIEVFRLDEVGSYNSIGQEKDKINISFTTISNLGIVEEVGIKYISIQSRLEGDDLYFNQPVDLKFSQKNSGFCMGSHTVDNPTIGLYYRGKQKHYIIANGIEYSYYTYTAEIQFTGK